MKYETKSAQYYNFFEDAKLIEIDHDNKKLAILLNGKEEIINIFDAGPYVDYNPYEQYIKEMRSKTNKIKDKKFGKLYIQEESNDLNVNEIFREISNCKKDFPNKNQLFNINNNINFKINSNNKLNSNNDQQLVEGKNLFIHNKYKKSINMNDNSTLPRLISKYNDNTDENNKKKGKGKEIIKKYNYNSLSKSKFQLYYLGEPRYYLSLKVKKPKIKHKLLSVITLNSDSVLGFKWFCFKKKVNKKDFENLSEVEKYIKKSKLLLVVGQEGLISVYQLINYQPFNHIRVDLTLTGLQSQPFSNFKERYNLVTSLKKFNPIIDYNLLDKPLNNEDLTDITLITLHNNNSFTFWKIMIQNGQINLTIQYNFQLQYFVCENFLMDVNEYYLICFNKKGIMILLLKLQSFPLPIIYRYTYNETIPPLKKLKEVILSNEVLSEKDDEKQNMYKKEKDKKIKEKNERKEKKEKRKYNKNYNYQKNSKNKKNKNKGNKYKENKIYDDGLVAIKESNGEENEENEENEEDEGFEGNFEEEEEDIDIDKDEFIFEEDPNFIDVTEDLFLEDDQYLKFIQKPRFLAFETKFLFVNYEIKRNEYVLYCFDISELYKVEEDQNFLSLCLNEFNDFLITKIYSSKEKIYFAESPYSYYHPINDNIINNKLLAKSSTRKKLIEMQYDINSIINNTYVGLFIREGDNIMIIKLHINNIKPDLELIKKDIELSKYIFYEQPTFENLKSNCMAIWTVNNTLIVNSVDSLFSIIKYRREATVLGIPISKKKIMEFISLNNN